MPRRHNAARFQFVKKRGRPSNFTRTAFFVGKCNLSRLGGTTHNVYCDLLAAAAPVGKVVKDSAMAKTATNTSPKRKRVHEVRSLMLHSLALRACIARLKILNGVARWGPVDLRHVRNHSIAVAARTPS